MLGTLAMIKKRPETLFMSQYKSADMYLKIVIFLGEFFARTAKRVKKAEIWRKFAPISLEYLLAVLLTFELSMGEQNKAFKKKVFDGYESSKPLKAGTKINSIHMIYTVFYSVPPALI
jgi:hypothetical protein